MQEIILGNSYIELKKLKENSVDSVVCDPPYMINFMGKAFDKPEGNPAGDKEFWKLVLRVLKPGGHLLAFGGTRTYHRMAVAIEDAGFEVRDMIEWVYSTGFPKSHNVWKHLKKSCKCGNMEVHEKRVQLQRNVGEKETKYYLRFLQEGYLPPTINTEKEQGEVLQSGLSEQSTSIRGKTKGSVQLSKEGGKSSVEGGSDLQKTEGELQGSEIRQVSREVSTNGKERRLHNGTQASDGSTLGKNVGEGGSSTPQRPQSEQQQYREPCSFCKQWGTQATRTFGVGTALKPAHEPICMARKPKEEYPPVLDVCCGPKGMWFDKNDKRGLFIDKRRENIKMVHPSGTRTANIQPDEIMDFTDLKYPDNSFYIVVMDPPHIVQENPSGMITKQYGHLTKDWRNVLKKGFSECFRVLKPNGTFIFKWCENNIPLKEILELTNEMPLFGNRSGKHLNTHWVSFIKRPEEQQQNTTPNHEPICMARKPLAEKTVAENVLKYGTGGINIDESRVGMNGEKVSCVQGQSKNQQSGEMYSGKDQRDKKQFENNPQGRFPANLILTWRENEYIIKEDITNEQKEKVCTWLQKNL